MMTAENLNTFAVANIEDFSEAEDVIVCSLLASNISDPDTFGRILWAYANNHDLNTEDGTLALEEYIRLSLCRIKGTLEAIGAAGGVLDQDSFKLMRDVFESWSSEPWPCDEWRDGRASLTWPWPITEPSGERGNGGFFEDEVSALKMLGYTVGKQGMTDKERRQFLDQFFRGVLPPQVVKHFGEKYGEPGTEERLKKMANLIAGVLRARKSHDRKRYRIAISHWETDLEYLKHNYYRSGSFPWPQLEP
ncbi:MAG: hypothetical protein K9L32_04860 [Chromatiaceae bacterium]|nr:hypothetical protein [Chromatiaceae bacterium]